MTQWAQGNFVLQTANCRKETELHSDSETPRRRMGSDRVTTVCIFNWGSLTLFVIPSLGWIVVNKKTIPLPSHVEYTTAMIFHLLKMLFCNSNTVYEFLYSLHIEHFIDMEIFGSIDPNGMKMKIFTDAANLAYTFGGTVHRDYFMVSERVRFLFTSEYWDITKPNKKFIAVAKVDHDHLG